MVINSIDLKFAPDTLTIGRELHAAAKRSIDRLNAALTTKIDEASLERQEQAFRQAIEDSFGNGSWCKTLPGRDILRRFVHVENLPVGYEVFRNLVMSKMAEEGYKPEGMKAVIDRIVVD